MRLPHTLIIAAGGLLALSAPALAEPDPATLCPNDPLAQDLIKWNWEHGQSYGDIIKQCQLEQQNEQPEPAPAPTATDGDEKVRSARKLFAANPRLKNLCHESYKDNLDDPSSFQLGSDYGDIYYLAANDTVLFSKKVRQKNQFGALTAYLITCSYRGSTMAI